MFGAPLLMGRTLGAAIGIECPVNSILDETMPVYRAGMIENDRIGLAIGRPQHATNHLPIQSHLLRRPRQDAAADRGHVPAFGQDHAIGDEFDFTDCQSRERCIALGFRCCAVDVLGANARFHKLVADVNRMRDADKRRRPSFGVRRICASG